MDPLGPPRVHSFYFMIIIIMCQIRILSVDHTPNKGKKIKEIVCAFLRNKGENEREREREREK